MKGKIVNKWKEIYYHRRRQLFHWYKEIENLFIKIRTRTILWCIVFLALTALMLSGNFCHHIIQKISSENAIKNVPSFSYEYEFFKTYYLSKEEKKQEEVKTEKSENIFSVKTIWPLRDIDGKAVYSVTREIDIPEKNWNSGHRGLDLRAPPHARIISPFDGTIRFVGVIAGRNIVSIENVHGVVMSFEPCITHLEKGYSIKRGDFLGIVGGTSLSGDSDILHLGVKIDKTYIDPRHIVFYKNIGLKTPLEIMKA